MNPNINYTPLLQLSSAYKQVIKATLKGKQLVITLVSVAVTIALTFAIKEIWVLALLVYSTYTVNQIRKMKDYIWQEFAIANGWQVDSEADVDKLIPGSLQFTNKYSLSPVIQAKLGNVDCDLFTYEFQNGKQQAVYTLARVKLEKALPHIILKNKKIWVGVKKDFDNYEKLQLEGDFDKSFTLEIERGQEVDALAIITPDIMQILIAYENAEDIEIVGNYLYFITGSDKRNIKNMQQLITSTIELSGKIIEHIHLTNGSAPSVAKLPAATPPIQQPIAPLPTNVATPPAAPPAAK